MKQTHTILSHIRQLPQFKSLQKHYCYQKFISLLSPRFQKAIAFVYIRDETLFVALSHPGFKMELNYNKDLLKSLLTLLIKSDKQCKRLKATRVVLFNSRYQTHLRPTDHNDTVPHYQEMASGKFNIQCDDATLRDAFLQIQTTIKQHS